MNILIHKSEEFSGFEVLLEVGNQVLEDKWKSVVNLTAGERECQLGGLTPLLTYSITVRGLIRPGVYSDMANPLVFKVLNAGLSLLTNLSLLVCV